MQPIIWSSSDKHEINTLRVEYLMAKPRLMHAADAELEWTTTVLF
jgi:hypothetical protein